MIDLQASLYSAQMISDASKETAVACRIDATKYVEQRDYRLAQTAIEIAQFCEAVVEAKARLQEGLANID